MAETLTTLRDVVELLLQDSSNDKWTTSMIDEAIRQALTLYSEKLPYRSITTVTLAAAGREVDVSSKTYRNIERVWWDYDSTDPAHPPHWRQFEVWDGAILYIKDDEEPAIGDVVRMWITADHTLNGLDAASVTTFPQNHARAIAWGAAGFAALSRAVVVAELSNVNKWAERNLRDWGENQIEKYINELYRLAAKEAALESGITGARVLDQFDSGYEAW